MEWEKHWSLNSILENSLHDYYPMKAEIFSVEEKLNNKLQVPVIR